MFRLLADESPWRRCARSWGLGVGAYLIAFVLVAGQKWLALVTTVPASAPPPPTEVHETLTVLAPPPGKPALANAFSLRTTAAESTPPGASVKISEGTNISFLADDDRQLVPVLNAFGGLIVFVPVLDRIHPRSAFRPDGTAAPVPATLDHWVRIRLANPAWWPEIEALSDLANQDGTLEAVAVLPPSYRSKLGAAVESRMAAAKSSAKITGVELRLQSGRPAGVVVESIRLHG